MISIVLGIYLSVGLYLGFKYFLNIMSEYVIIRELLPWEFKRYYWLFIVFGPLSFLLAWPLIYLVIFIHAWRHPEFLKKELDRRRGM